MSLFDSLNSDAPVGHAGIVNADDDSMEIFVNASPSSRTFGIRRHADVSASQVICDATGCRFRLDTPVGSRQVALHLLGRFNIYNALAAATTALHLGVALDDIARELDRFEGLPGRMQAVDCDQGFRVFIDYAHTFQGLAAAIESVQALATGRTIVVFGQAGERHRKHRVEMVKTLVAAGVFFILTTDNPGMESQIQIVGDMASIATDSGVRRGTDFECAVDRRLAFQLALDMAQRGDVVLLAGRGNERVIKVGDETITFRDADVAAETLRKHLGRE